MYRLYKLERTNLTFCSVNDYKVNRFFLLFIFFLLSSISVFAQFSVQTQYHTGLQNNQSSWPSSYTLDGSIHYWTRLKKYRLELLPGFLFQSISTDHDNFQNVGVTIPASFYIMDFVNDCDCPTFSKNSFWFQKGFFIRLTPSWTKNINQSKPELLNQLFGVGITLGLDLGISDLLTLTPLIGYDQLHSLSGSSAHGDYLHFGLSILIRHDYSRRYR